MIYAMLGAGERGFLNIGLLLSNCYQHSDSETCIMDLILGYKWLFLLLHSPHADLKEAAEITR